MTYRQVHDNLYAHALTPEQHSRTCGYWFTVTSGSTAHTAFRTWQGLIRWLEDRGLSLEYTPCHPPEQGGMPEGSYLYHGDTVRIPGSYASESHGRFLESDEGRGMTEDDSWHSLTPVLATAVMSNAEYTLGLITQEQDMRTVHYLNVNVRTRVIFDRKNTERWLES